MIIKVYDEKKSLGRAAADHVAISLRSAIHDRGRARIIAATGASQFEFLDALTGAPEIDWSRVEMFHLDEYIGLPISHPASFRKYLLDRLISKTGITKYHLLEADGDVPQTILSIGRELNATPADIAFVGIGENGHLAFNDPPADFLTEEPYLIVSLDEDCRRQQVSEGWFTDLSQVPRKAMSMSVRQILKAKEIIAVVPDARKAPAVKACLEDKISPSAPASILRTHPNTTVFLDRYSAALLDPEIRDNVEAISI
jgi:glucosamine-6-phosphate deaminase